MTTERKGLSRRLYNRFWQRKLMRMGLPYVHAGLIAQHIAIQCDGKPPHERAAILREWGNPEKHRKPLLVIRKIMGRRFSLVEGSNPENQAKPPE